MTTRTEINVEVDEIIVVRSRGAGTQIWCPTCGSLAIIVTPEMVAGMARMHVRTINWWVEAKRVHSLKMENGLLLLCINSLITTVREQDALSWQSRNRT